MGWKKLGRAAALWSYVLAGTVLGVGLPAAAAPLCGPDWAPCAVLRDDALPIPGSRLLTGKLGLALTAGDAAFISVPTGPTVYVASPLGPSSWSLQALPQSAFRAAVTVGTDDVARALAEDNVTYGAYHFDGSSWLFDGSFPPSQLYTTDFYTDPAATEHLLFATPEGFYKPLYGENAGAGWTQLVLGPPGSEFRLLSLGMSRSGAVQAAYTARSDAEGARLLWSSVHGTDHADFETVTDLPLTRDQFFMQDGLATAVSDELFPGLLATPHLMYALTGSGTEPSAIYYATRRWDGSWDVDRVERGRILQTCPAAPTALGQTCTDERVELSVLGIVARRAWEVRMFYDQGHSTASFTSRAGPGATLEWGPPVSTHFSSQVRVAWPWFWGGFGRANVRGGTTPVGDATVRLGHDGKIQLALTEGGDIHRWVIGSP